MMSLGFCIFSIILNLFCNIAVPLYFLIVASIKQEYPVDYVSIWFYIRCTVALADGVAVILFLIALIGKLNELFLSYCFYFLFEFSVLCFTWSSFYLSSEDIAKVNNVVIASFFQRFIPVQLSEFVVFIMTTVCFIIRSCEPKPIDVPPPPEPELIDISMSPPLPVAEVHSTSFDNGEIYRPLLQPDDEMNTIVEIEPVEIPVPAIPIDLPDVPLELPIEPVEPYIIQALPSQVVSIEEYENTEPIIAEIVEITATEETEDLPVERQSSEETSFSGVPIMSKEVVDELSKTIKQHNEEHKLNNSSNTDDYTPENQK